MPVAGQTPTRVHYVDSESITWTAGAAYVDPNDATKLVRDVQAHEQELQLYAADTGAANTYVITLSPAPTIVVGTKFVIKAAHANTGASTLAVNGASAIAIVKGVSTPLAGGEILAGQVFEVTFDGTNYQLAGGTTSPGGATNSTQFNNAGAFGGYGPGTAGQRPRSNGASAAPTFSDATRSVGVIIDGGGATPSTGSKKYIQIPFAANIVRWSLAADASGSAQITVKKCADGSFPTTASIVASAPPNLSSAQKAESSTLTGWTTAISADDWLEFNLDSVSGGIQWLILILKITEA